MDTLETIESEFYEYCGPVDLCKGGGGGAAIDKAYNAGMLELSQEQQAMAGEMYNMYKYGVSYDPTKQVQVSGGTSTGTKPNPEYEAWEARNTKYQNAKNQSDKWKDRHGDPVPPGPAPPKEIADEAGPAVYSTVGEQNGYDPNSVLSQMELDQMGVEAQAELLPFMTNTQKSQFELQRQQAEAAAGLIPLQTQTQESALQTQQAGLGLQRSQIATAGRLLPEQEQTQLDQLRLQQQQLASQGRTLPSEESAKLAELERMETKSLAETDLIGERAATESAGLGLQQNIIQARGSLLGGETELSRERTGLERERTTASGSLLPGETELSRERTADSRKELRERSPAVSELYRQALQGPNVERRSAEAVAGVEHAFKGAEGSMARERSRRGLGVDRTGRDIRNIGIEKAKAKASGTAGVRRQADEEQFGRLLSVTR